MHILNIYLRYIIYIHYKSLLGGLWALFVIRLVFEYARYFSPIRMHASPLLPPSPHLHCPPPQTSLPSTAAAYCCCLLLLSSVAAFYCLSQPAFTRYNLHSFLDSCCCPQHTFSLQPSQSCISFLSLSL